MSLKTSVQHRFFAVGMEADIDAVAVMCSLARIPGVPMGRAVAGARFEGKAAVETQSCVKIQIDIYLGWRADSGGGT